MSRRYRTNNPATGNFNQNDGVPGVVYILKNEAFKENWIKIGCSRHSGHARARDMTLKASPGLPAHHVCVFEYKTLDCGRAEKSVHAALSAHRKGRQEFFECETEKAKEKIIFFCQKIDEEIKSKEQLDHNQTKNSSELRKEKFEVARKERDRELFLRQQQIVVQASASINQTTNNQNDVPKKPVQEQAQEQVQEASSSTNIVREKNKESWWSTFWPIIASIVAMKFVGLIGVIAGLAAYYLIRPKFGAINASVVGCITGIAVGLISGAILLDKLNTPAESKNTAHLYTAPVTAPQVQTANTQPDNINPLQAEMELLDKWAPSWRQTVQSNNFKRWLSAQSDQVKNNFNTTETAAEMYSILNAYNNSTQPQTNENLTNKKTNKTTTINNYEPQQPIPGFYLSRESINDLEKTKKRMYETYPYLLTTEGQLIVEKINNWRDDLIKKGTYPSVAMQQAVNALAPANDPNYQGEQKIEVRIR